MKRKRIAILMTVVLCLAVLSACGDGSESQDMRASFSEEPTEQPKESEEEPVESTEVYVPLEHTNYVPAEMSESDYGELAQNYEESGSIKKQRDTLEYSWMLYGDEEAFTQLQDIVVNVEEENPLVKDMAQQLWQNLEILEYRNEALATISSENWMPVMMPKLLEGKRNYYMEEASTGNMMIWQTGYDIQGQAFTEVWYQEGDQLLYLQQTQEVVRMIMAEWKDGAYQGAFESWTCEAESGNVYHETGTLQDGILTGAYTIEIHTGKESVDLFNQWSLKEDLSYKKYVGDFNSDGTIAVKQLDKSRQQNSDEAEKDKDQLIYAYSEDEKEYLFLNVPEGTDVKSYVFPTQMLGMKAKPEVTPYEPVEDEDQEIVVPGDLGEDVLLKASELKFRIFDSNLEWYDGAQWHVLGSVEEYMKDDLTKDYTGRQEQAADITKDHTDGSEQTEENGNEENNEGNNEDDGNETAVPSREFSSGKVKEEAPKPSTPKPSTPPPSTPKPSTPTPPPSSEPESEPSYEPEPEPSYEPEPPVEQNPPTEENPPTEQNPPTEENPPTEQNPPTQENPPTEQNPSTEENPPAEQPPQIPSEGDGGDMEYTPDIM